MHLFNMQCILMADMDISLFLLDFALNILYSIMGCFDLNFISKLYFQFSQFFIRLHIINKTYICSEENVSFDGKSDKKILSEYYIFFTF